MPHVFPNVLDMVPQDTWQGCTDFQSLVRASAATYLKAMLPCTQCTSCHSTRQLCPLPEVDMDVGGLPCVDFSVAGHRAGREWRTANIFVTWAKRHKFMRTKLLILENSQVA